DAEIPWPDTANDRVEIGPVAVEIPAGLVQRIGDGDDIAFEEAARVRVGQHDGRNVRPDLGSERLEIDAAGPVGRDRLDGEAAGDCRCRIGAVRRFRYQHATPDIAAVVEGGANGHHAA